MVITIQFLKNTIYYSYITLSNKGDEKLDNFKELTLEDKSLMDYYTQDERIQSYSYRFSSQYLWRNLCKPHFYMIDDTLIILKKEPDIGWYFMMPLNYTKDNLEYIITNLKKISLNIPGCNFLLGDLEDFFISDIKLYTPFNIKVNNSRDNFEYVYSTKNLISLRGKKYHGKRNHYNSFLKNYDISIVNKPCDKVIYDCNILLKNWCSKRANLTDDLICEKEAVEDVLVNIDYLGLNFIGIYVENTLIAFSIGEQYKDTAIIHTERCDNDYKGVYSFINKSFLINDFSNTIWVNRQEDCGECGLRNSKESYHPDFMISKSLIKL